MNDATNRTLEAFFANSALPFGEAKTAPRQIYTDPALFDLECIEIFDKDWVFAGRAGEIPEFGDYFTLDVAKQPVAVIRQEDGSIKAFANVCLHRYVKLLEGAGNKKRFSCPYHAWTYKADGELMRAPFMEQVEGFTCKGKRLNELRVELWHGFIFVSKNHDVKSVAERMKPLEKELGSFGLDRFHDLFNEEDEFNCNWKALVENFTESYHLFQTHAPSGGAISTPTKLIEKGHSNQDSYSVHFTPWGESYEFPLHNAQADKNFERKSLIIGLFPNGLVAMRADAFWWMALQPMSVDKVRIRWGTSFSPEYHDSKSDPKKELFDEYHSFIQKVNEEDREIVEGVQKGANYRDDYQGSLHPYEEQVYNFNVFVANKLKHLVQG